MFKSNSVMKIKLTGLNFERLLQFLKQNNCIIYDVDRPDYKTLEFTISVSDYKKIIKLNGFRNYNVKVEKSKGLYFFITNIKKKIGLIVGIITTIFLFSFFSMFTFNINVLGNENIKTNEIINVLKENNIKIGKINKFKNNEVELLLKQKLEDISLVSVIKQGTNIVINIKEKEKTNEEEFFDIIAPTNLVITSIIVNQGYGLKKVGDIVKKGDVIVGAYTIQEGKKVPCKPIATIEAEAYYLGHVEFETKEITYIKTGKKIVNSWYEIFNTQILKSTKTHNFKHYKTEVINTNLFNNLFLPIKIYKETVYELKEKVITHNFEKEKAKLIAESKTLAYSIFPQDLTVIEENIIISQLNTKYIIQTVLKSKLNLSFS